MVEVKLEESAEKYRGFYKIENSTWPLLSGNGELVTGFGSTGYHTDGPVPHMQVFCLAGRRINIPNAPLVRFGQLKRTLIVGDQPSQADRYEQELVPSSGILLSRNEHELIEENTTSFVCLESNSAAFRTTLTNTSDRPISGKFVVDYRFGDWEGSLPPNAILHVNPLPQLNGVQMSFEVDKKHLGALDLFCSEPVDIETGNQSFSLAKSYELAPGESCSVDFLFGIGDRLRFRYTPHGFSFDELLRQQERAWGEFHGASVVELGSPELEALRLMCMYDMRCNSTPWSIPPVVSPAAWEGRTFHDELYPFLGLLSGGHVDLAKKIPFYRLHTLPQAMARSAFRGAKYAWESLEDGGDGSPYGPWIEEHFHMGQFAEAAWQLCLYSDNPDLKNEFYPMLREIADYYLLNLVEWNDEIAWIRACTDYDETIYPVENGIYTACAAIRSMELALRVGEELGESERKLAPWREISAKLRRNLPGANEERYKTAAGATHHHIAEIGPIFPFRTDQGTTRAAYTLDSFCQAARTDAGLQPGDLPGYVGNRWLWSTSHASTAYSILNNPDRAYDLLENAPAAVGPGMIPAEQVFLSGGMSIPFFTTGAGGYLFALHNLFVQVTDDGVTRLSALPSELSNVSYENLPGAQGVRYSAKADGGRVTALVIDAPSDRVIEVIASERLLSEEITRWETVREWRKGDGFYHLTLALAKGKNTWSSS